MNLKTEKEYKKRGDTANLSKRKYHFRLLLFIIVLLKY